MAKSHRRSSRLQGGAPTHHSNVPLPMKLSSLLEHNESPPSVSQAQTGAPMSPPIAQPNTAISQRASHLPLSAIKTPNTTSRFYPSLEEMHPSKAHLSTTKIGKSESRFRLEVPKVLGKLAGPEQSPFAVIQSMPTKLRDSLPSHMSSPNFDFTLARPESHLSMEAQKIMNSVREEAAKIKAQMQAKRDEQDPKDGEANQPYAVEGRKIAKPKGRSGRYSGVHMQEFKKMDSIVGHASTWKTKFQNVSSLKPSKSKPRLQGGEPGGGAQRSKNIRSNDEDRIENSAPGKRARKNYSEDASAARPSSREAVSENVTTQSIPLKAWTRTGLPSAATTPTRASLARSASVKHTKTSMIPSLSRSHSTKTIKSPIAPRTEGGNKHLSSLASLSSMKSILHRHQPNLSTDVAKPAEATHLPTSSRLPNLDKELPSLPSTPHPSLFRTPTAVKRVDFTPSTKSGYDLAAASPSPSKIPAMHHPSENTAPVSDEPILYPSLTNSPNITTRFAKPPLSRNSTPGEFTFHVNDTPKFDPTAFSGKIPSTIRKVRPSGITTPMATAFTALQPIPHGMPNKKRRRADSDDEELGVENLAPAGTAEDGEDGPRSKKPKTLPQKDAPLVSGGKRNVSRSGEGGSEIPNSGGISKRQKGRGVLSLSRLHMLSRPKGRR